MPIPTAEDPTVLTEQGIDKTAGRAGDFDTKYCKDVLTLQYGWPNSLWAKQTRAKYIRNIFTPINQTTIADNLIASGQVYGATPLPTYSEVTAVNCVVAIDGASLFTANGAAVSSFTDAVGNRFVWVGANPPCFSTIPQVGQANAKGINFHSATGYFSANLSNNSQIANLISNPARSLAFISLSTFCPTAGTFNITQSAIVPKILFEASGPLIGGIANGLGFAPIAQLMDHQDSLVGFYGDVMLCNTSAQVKDPAWGLIYPNDPFGQNGTYWQGHIGPGAYIGSYNTKRMAPPILNGIVGQGACYSPASACSTSAVLYVLDLLRENPGGGFGYPPSLFSIQPTKTCVDMTTNLPIVQGALGDVSSLSLAGNFYLGNGSLNNSATMFKGILYNLTVFNNNTLIDPLTLTQYRAMLKYLNAYERFTTYPQWFTQYCPGPSICQPLFP